MKLKEEKNREGTTLFVGIDLALKTNYVVIVDSQGVKLASFSIDNDLIGAKLLRDKLLSLVEEKTIVKYNIKMCIDRK
jgi:hypothetical protein